MITIKLKPTSHVAGRVTDQTGRPVADRTVEIWSRGLESGFLSGMVELAGGPLKTVADGSFQTPDNLMTGSTYRVAVRGDDIEPVYSDWITIGAKPQTLPPLVLRHLRSVSGRVVDRQGKPLAGIEVFQTGDGPRATRASTDAGGRFVLGGFRQGPVFLLARADGFRFHGQLIRRAESEVTVELTRTTERPTRALPMLPDPIPGEELRALARRLIEPFWNDAGTAGTDRAKFRELSALAAVDPARLLAGMENYRFESPAPKLRLQKELVLALAAKDFDEATAYAETIADAGARSDALVQLSDRLPAKDRTRKLALLKQRAARGPDCDRPGPEAARDQRCGRSLLRPRRARSGEGHLCRCTRGRGERRQAPASGLRRKAGAG